MGRPRKRQTGLPSYCYVKPGSGAYFMKRPGPDGTWLTTFYGRDLEAMLRDWRAVWGPRTLQEHVVAMSGLFDAFLVEIAQRRADDELSATTALDYERCVRMLRPVWGRVRIKDVDPPGLKAWQDARRAQSRVRCNRERTALSECFKLAIVRGWCTENPVERLKPLKETPRDRYVTDAEFAAVYHHAQPVVQAAMILAAITGLRQGDLLRLRRSDFDVDRGLTVRTRKTGQPMQFSWTEGLKRGVLAAVGARDFVPMVLLSTEKGSAYTSDGFRSLWHRAMAAALASGALGKRFTFNDLRAKAGSESPDWRLLGHLDQRTFERVYNRLPRQVKPNR